VNETIEELFEVLNIAADREAGRLHLAMKKEQVLAKVRAALGVPDPAIPDDTVQVSER
jgi:hypothetical protein